MPGGLIVCPLTDEQKDQYVENFDLQCEPQRPPGTCCCCRVVPLFPTKPTAWERRTGGLLYEKFGAQLLIQWLKQFSCYPTPIRGTLRGTAERERALILTIPITVGYEAGHSWGGLVHLLCLVAVLVLIILLLPPGESLLRPLIIVGAQVPFLWFIHVLPCMAQRLNRIRLYAGIEQIQSQRLQGP
jgi:hypothetical protein